MIGWAGLVTASVIIVIADVAVSDAYESLIYDHEVAAECGLLSADARGSFRRARDDLAARSNLEPDALKALRLSAIVRAMREYDNRGLGGYKAWCKQDGKAGVARIIAADPLK